MEMWAKETADERMLRNTGFLSELLQGKVSLDGAGSADAHASPAAREHASALLNTQHMTDMKERQRTRGMTARSKFNRDTYTTLMSSSQTPIQTPLEGYAQQKVHGVPMTYSQSVHPTVGRGGDLTRYSTSKVDGGYGGGGGGSATGGKGKGKGKGKGAITRGNGSFTRLRPLILQHEPTTVVDTPLDRSLDGLFNGFGSAGKRRRLQTSPTHEPDEGGAPDLDAIEFYPTPVNKLTHDLIAAIESLLRAKLSHPEGKALVLPKFVEVAQNKCVDCILLRAGGGYFRLGVPKVGSCNCFKCGMLLDFDVRTNTHLTRGKMRHKVLRMGHPDGEDDAALMARRAADWMTAEDLADNATEASRQLEELERLKMMQAMAAKGDNAKWLERQPDETDEQYAMRVQAGELAGLNLFKPAPGETTKEWMQRMEVWATTRQIGESEEDFQARIAKWLERQPDETDEQYAMRMRAYHKRKEGESQMDYLERISKLSGVDMATLKELSGRFATIEDAEEHAKKMEEEAKKAQSRKFWGILRKSVVKTLPSLLDSSKLFEIVKAAREAKLRGLLAGSKSLSGGAGNWNKLRMPLNTMWHAKKAGRKKTKKEEGMLNAVNVQLTDMLDEAVEEEVRIAIAEVQEENAMLAVLLDDVIAEMVKGIAMPISKTSGKKKRKMRPMPKTPNFEPGLPGAGAGAHRKKTPSRATMIAKAGDAKNPNRKTMVDYLTKYALVDEDKLALYKVYFQEFDQPQTGSLDGDQLTGALAMVSDKKDADFVDEIMDILKDTCDLEEIMHADFKLFTIFASLIEKIVSFEKQIDLDSGIGKRQLTVGQKLRLQINKAKTLFYMCDFDDVEGTVPITSIEHEIQSGGMKEEETEAIINALYARGINNFTFLDFMDYVPFFNNLHGKIVVSGFHNEGKTDEEKEQEALEEETMRQKMLNPQGTYEADVQYKERINDIVMAVFDMALLKERTMKASLGGLGGV